MCFLRRLHSLLRGVARRVRLAAAFRLAAAATAAPPAVADHAPWGTSLRISVVWPHDGRGAPAAVAQSRAANVAVWPTRAVGCREAPESNGLTSVRLLVAADGEPAEFAEVERPVVQRTVGGVAFPSLEFANVPAELAARPGGAYRFVAWATDATIWTRGSFASNVWVHAADARTLLPEPVVPEGVSRFGSELPGSTGYVAARIQQVWPHDAGGAAAPVGEAPFVNVAVDLFWHGTRHSVPPEPDGAVPHLFLAVGNGSLQLVAVPVYVPGAGSGPAYGTPDQNGISLQKTAYAAGGLTYPRWVFNDVPVTPGEPHHFAVGAFHPGGKSVSPYSTIWTHAPDARTVLPHPEPPPPCVP